LFSLDRKARVEVPTYIRNHEALLNVFGYWPSFHDANVLAYVGPTATRQTVDLGLHTSEMTSEVDAKGYFVLREHVLVTFRFSNVHDSALERFDSGNILFATNISHDSDAPSLRVELDSVMDLSGSFAARSAEVLSVLPCTSEAKAI